jgi:hypothetical protein
MNDVAVKLLRRFHFASLPRFHRLMAFSGMAVLLISLVGCRLTAIYIPDIESAAFGCVILTGLYLLLPLYWHEMGRMDLRDAALTLPWYVFFKLTLPCTVGIAGRLGMSIPLQDDFLARLDHFLGFNVPAIATYAAHHWLGRLINGANPLLLPFLYAATFIPALTGKVRNAQQFLVSNLIAFLIGVPIYGFLPAIGPWFGYHLAPNPTQIFIQQSVLNLRTPGPYSLMVSCVICIPSFHVIWAMLCANALWCFNFLRIPLALLSATIIVSTMTGCWHYFVDVLAGILVASVAIALSRALCRWHTPQNLSH